MPNFVPLLQSGIVHEPQWLLPHAIMAQLLECNTQRLHDYRNQALQAERHWVKLQLPQVWGDHVARVCYTLDGVKALCTAFQAVELGKLILRNFAPQEAAALVKATPVSIAPTQSSYAPVYDLEISNPGYLEPVVEPIVPQPINTGYRMARDDRGSLAPVFDPVYQSQPITQYQQPVNPASTHYQSVEYAGQPGIINQGTLVVNHVQHIHEPETLHGAYRMGAIALLVGSLVIPIGAAMMFAQANNNQPTHHGASWR